MAKFLVKTHAFPNGDTRTLVIEADRFSLRASNDVYEFFTGSETDPIASVPGNTVFAVAKADVITEDCFEGEDDTDDVCLDCRFKELLASDEFFDEVYNIIEAYNDAGKDSPEVPNE